MKSALILIDIQNDYFPGGAMESAGMTQAAAEARELLDACRRPGGPFSTCSIWPWGRGPRSSARDTAGGGNPRERPAAPRRGPGPETFTQRLQGHRLVGGAEAAGVDEVIIAGAMSHMCIDATTRAAFDDGFTCTVIHDACASRDVVFEGQASPWPRSTRLWRPWGMQDYARGISLRENFLANYRSAQGDPPGRPYGWINVPVGVSTGAQ